MRLLGRLFSRNRENEKVSMAQQASPVRPEPIKAEADVQEPRRILIAKCLEVLKDQMDAHMSESVFVPCSVSCDFFGTKNKALLRVIPDGSDQAICRLTASAVRKGSDLCVMNYLFTGTRQEMKEWLSGDTHVEELIGYIVHLSEALDEKLD